MATYIPEDLISHDLACPICFEDYDILCRQRAPKLLLCLHTFCFGCAQRLWQPNGTLECSLCRTVHSGVALNELFDNPVILDHLRKECEEQDMELARRLDMEMRNRERHILNSAPPPPPPPLRDMVHLQSEEEDESNEEEEAGDGDEDLQDMVDDGHVNIFDSDGTVEEEEDDEEEEEEEESGNEGQMNDFLDRCIGGMLDRVNNVVERLHEAIDNGVEEIDDAEDVLDVLGEIDDSVVEIDDRFDGVDQMDEILEGQDHEEEDDGDNSGSSSGDEGEPEDVMGDMRVTMSWNNLPSPQVQSEEEEEEEEEEDEEEENDACHENDDNNVEEDEEEDRWYSASELVMSPQWVEDDFSMDDDPPDSPDFADEWLLL